MSTLISSDGIKARHFHSKSASFLDDLSTIIHVQIFLLLYYLKKLGLNVEHQGDLGDVYI